MIEAPPGECEGFETCPALTAEELFKAKGHLYASLKSIEEQAIKIGEGIYDALVTSSELSECWLQVNKCRLYTEDIAAFEELLQPAMGLINDAKCMVDHLAAGNMGLTRHGQISIITALNEASALIKTVLEELEFWDTTEEEEEAER